LSAPTPRIPRQQGIEVDINDPFVIAGLDHQVDHALESVALAVLRAKIRTRVRPATRSPRARSPTAAAEDLDVRRPALGQQVDR